MVVLCYNREALEKKIMLVYFLILVPLGSVPELPAESCAEIRARERDNLYFNTVNSSA